MFLATLALSDEGHYTESYFYNKTVGLRKLQPLSHKHGVMHQNQRIGLAFGDFRAPFHIVQPMKIR